MADIIIRPEANLERSTSGKWYVNQELCSGTKIFNQQLGEYLAKLFFNLPVSTSSLVRIKDGRENNIEAPFFYDQKGRRYIFITDIIKKDNSIDLVDVMYVDESKNILNYKLNKLHNLCNSENEYLNLKEELIKLVLFDFFIGQYGRGFKNDVYLTRTNALHLLSIHNLGNCYDFNETIKEKVTCDSIFGLISIEEFSQLVYNSKCGRFYLNRIAGADFSQILNSFYDESFIEVNPKQKIEYINYAKEKQAILTRIL